MSKPRAFTKKEIRDMYLAAIREIATYWASVPGKTSEEKCSGVAFSILALIDGANAGLPGLHLHVQPHPDDKEYCKKQGENWFPMDLCFNDNVEELHELFNKRRVP